MQDIYVTSAGDTWDSIAYTLFGDEKYMQQLMQANWDLLDILVFPANQVILVPKIPISTENELDQPSWRSVDSSGDPLFTDEDLEVSADG